MFADLSLTPQTILLLASVAVTVVAALLALFAALFAQSYASGAKRSLERAQQNKYFGSLDRAGQFLVDNPRLLVTVHGLDDQQLSEMGEDEAGNLAYFFLLMNGFRQLYDERFGGNFNKMERALKKRPSALNLLLRVEANRGRLPHIARMYDDGTGRRFMQAVNRLAEFEAAPNNSGDPA